MKYLALSVISKPDTKLTYELAKFFHAAGCIILEARWFGLGGEGMGHYLLEGNWNAIAKLETQLSAFEKKHAVTVLPRRVELKEAQPDRLPYTIYLLAKDRPGIVQDVMGFLTDEAVDVLDVYAYTFQAHITQAKMASLTISLSIPAKILISDFREHFIGFCDELNLDATLEPDKN